MTSSKYLLIDIKFNGEVRLSTVDYFQHPYGTGWNLLAFERDLISVERWAGLDPTDYFWEWSICIREDLVLDMPVTRK